MDLARAYRRDGRAAQAREEVRRVLEKMPHHHLAWLAYGDVLVDLEQYADACVAFERARLTDPQRAAGRGGNGCPRGRRPEDARSEFFAISCSKTRVTWRRLCGLAALSLAADKANDAERLLRHALRQSAHHPLAWRGLGQALMALGRLAEADAAARRLIKIEPENPQSWITIASVSTRLMRQEQALEAYEQAARLQPEEVRLRMSIGHVHKTLGRRARQRGCL